MKTGSPSLSCRSSLIGLERFKAKFLGKRKKKGGQGCKKKRRRLIGKNVKKKKDFLPQVLQQVSQKELVCMQLRRIQSRTGCSTNTLNLAINAISPYCKFNLPRLTHADKFWRELSGASVIRLHGCVGKSCTHVFGPDDARTHCPLCNEGRYNVQGKPKETCYYFPLKEKIKKLLGLPHFHKALQHEWE